MNNMMDTVNRTLGKRARRVPQNPKPKSEDKILARSASLQDKDYLGGKENLVLAPSLHDKDYLRGDSAGRL